MNAAQTKAAQGEETFFITEKRIIYLNKNTNLKKWRITILPAAGHGRIRWPRGRQGWAVSEAGAGGEASEI
jgi:hypothetical protein